MVHSLQKMPPLPSIPESISAQSCTGDSSKSPTSSRRRPLTSTRGMRPRRPRVLIVSKRKQSLGKVLVGNATLARSQKHPAHPVADLGHQHPKPAKDPGHEASSSLPEARMATEAGCDTHVAAKTPSLPSSPGMNQAFLDLSAFPVPPRSGEQDPAYTPAAQSDHRQMFSVGDMIPTTVRAKASANRQQSACRAPTTDGASDALDRARKSSVDSALIEAISISVAQQLRAFSLSNYPRLQTHDRLSRGGSADTYAPGSRTSSQRIAVDRFTKDLEKYAEFTGAKGKRPLFPSTSSPSAATLRTISALLPFRSEFRAAGMAVTSKEQTKGIARHPPKTGIPFSLYNTSARRRSQETRPSQWDGNGSNDAALNRDAAGTTPAPPITSQSGTQVLARGKAEAGSLLSHQGHRSTYQCLPCLPTTQGQSCGMHWGRLQPPLGGLAATSGQAASHASSLYLPRPARKHHPMPQRLRATSYDPAQARQARSAPRRSITSSERRIMYARPRTFFQPRPRHSVADKRQTRPDSQSFRLAQTLSTLQTPRPAGGHRVSRGHGDESTKPPITNHHPKEGNHGQARELLLFPPIMSGESHETGLRSQHTLKDDQFLYRQGKALGQDQDNYRASAAPPLACAKHHASVGVKGQRLSEPPIIPRRTSSIRGSIRSAAVRATSFGIGEISDADVLNGLGIVAAAAFDPRRAAKVRRQTGLQIRLLLAELAYDGLGQSLARDEAATRRELAELRRQRLKKLKQHLRHSQLMEINRRLAL